MVEEKWEQLKQLAQSDTDKYILGRLYFGEFPFEHIKIVWDKKDKILNTVSLTDVGKKQIQWYVTKGLAKVLSNGLSLYIWGTYGVGKTSLLCYIVMKLLKFGLDENKYLYVRFVDEWSLKENYIKDSSADNDKFKSLVEEDILVIDNLGAGDVIVSEQYIELLDTLLRQRSSKELVTIIVANVMPKEIANKYGQSIASVLGVVDEGIDGLVYKDVQLQGVDLRSKSKITRW